MIRKFKTSLGLGGPSARRPPPLPECGLHPRPDGLPDLQDGSLGGGGQGGSGQEDGGDGRGAEDTEGGGGAFCGACAGEGEVVWKPLDGTPGDQASSFNLYLILKCITNKNRCSQKIYA